ncbi:MAG: 30S ribosomal protein S18 [Candidatus Omnitrophota bacterium]
MKRKMSSSRRPDRKEKRSFTSRRAPGKFKIAKDTKIDYKDFNLLRKYVTDRGKILSRRISGVTAKQQRAICRELKKSRFLGLISAVPQRRSQW